MDKRERIIQIIYNTIDEEINSLPSRKEPLKKFRQTPELMSLIFSKWRELYEEYGKTTTGEFQGALRYVLTEHLYQYTFQFVYSGHASD